MSETYVTLTETEKSRLKEALNSEFAENRITMGGFIKYMSEDYIDHE
jgi:hypothetical protein